MSSFQTHFERLELKFLIDEIVADRIRAQIRPYCTADRHSAEGLRSGFNGYVINSLYLDTPALAFHAAKERGDPNRIKLRVRTYYKSPTATLEVKCRRSNVIDKRRAIVASSEVARAAQGTFGPGSCPGQSDSVIRDFARTVATSGAQPKLTVRYEREAYESQVDHYARVTFDRRIRVRPTRDWNLYPDESNWCRIDDHWRTPLPTHPVVLELKCETAVPRWMSELIRCNELAQTSFSKYSVGICLTHWMMGGDVSSSRSIGALG